MLLFKHTFAGCIHLKLLSSKQNSIGGRQAVSPGFETPLHCSQGVGKPLHTKAEQTTHPQHRDRCLRVFCTHRRRTPGRKIYLRKPTIIYCRRLWFQTTLILSQLSQHLPYLNLSLSSPGTVPMRGSLTVYSLYGAYVVVSAPLLIVVIRPIIQA